MTVSTSAALEVSLAYFRTWTGGDFPAALRYIAPDIVCRTPAGMITGAAAFADFMGPFAGMLKSADLLAAFGDEDTALITYDTATVLVDDAPGAELHTVVDGRISAIKIIFDRLPFERARSAASSGSAG
jgi:SnoaL-like domain